MSTRSGRRIIRKKQKGKKTTWKGGGAIAIGIAIRPDSGHEITANMCMQGQSDHHAVGLNHEW